MEPRRDLGVLPIPPHRKRRIPIFIGAGAVLLVAGWAFEIAFIWGLGVGLLVAAGIALLLDRFARRRS